jgi:hypothetical protein
MTVLWRRLAALAALVSAALFLAPMAEAQGRRLALVVGNAHYQSLPQLATPGEDASRMAEALRRLGFEVTLLSDVSDGMFEAMLNVVAEQAKGAEAVVFYYAGHAFQINGENFLLPVEAAPDPANPAASAWSMSDVLLRLQSSGATTLVFLDACRNNPVGASVGGDGLAPMDSAAGTFVAFATRPGQVSYDKGDGAVSPFAQALLTHIETPGLGISDMMIRVRRDVEAATVGRQVPWDQSSLRESFQFRPVVAETPDPPAATSGDDAFAGLEIVEPETVVAAASSAPVPGGSDTPVVRAAPSAEPSLPKVSSAPRVPAPGEDAGLTADVPDDAEGPATPPVKLEKLSLAALKDTGEAAAPVALGGGLRIEAAAGPAWTPAIAARVSAVPPRADGLLAPHRAAVELASYAPKDRERLVPVPDASAPAGEDPVTGLPAAAKPAPLPEELPAAVQSELKRVGCYGLGVDGDWGGGSRSALKAYYEAKKQEPVEPLDPTEALWRTLSAEPEGVCKQPVAAAPKPKKPAAAKPKTTTKTAAKPKTNWEKPAAEKPKAAPKQPAEKKGVKCKFMVVAIVCS